MDTNAVGTDGESERMVVFYRDCENKIRNIRRKSDLVTAKAKELAEYWGENSKDFPIEKVADVLSQFCKNLKQSVAKLMRVRANARRASQRMKRGKSKGKNSLQTLELCAPAEAECAHDPSCWLSPMIAGSG